MNCDRFWLCLHLNRSASVYCVASEKGTIPRFEGLYLLLIHADVRFEKVLHCFALNGEANGSQISCDEWERVCFFSASRRTASHLRASSQRQSCCLWPPCWSSCGRSGVCGGTLWCGWTDTWPSCPAMSQSRDEPFEDVDVRSRCRPSYLCLWVHDADALLVDEDPDLVRPTGLKCLLQGCMQTESLAACSHFQEFVFVLSLSCWLTLTSKKVQPKVGHVAMVSRKVVLASCTVNPLCWL